MKKRDSRLKSAIPLVVLAIALFSILLVGMYLNKIELVFLYIIMVLVLTIVIIKRYWAFYVYIISLFLIPYLYINVGVGKEISAFDIVLAVCFLKFIFLSFESERNVNGRVVYPKIWYLLLALGFVSFLTAILLLNNPLGYSALAFVKVTLPMTVFLWAFFLAKRETKVLVSLLRFAMVMSILMSSLGILALLKFGPLVRVLELFRTNSYNVQSILDIGILMPKRLAWSVPAATAQGNLLAIAIILSLCIYSKTGLNRLWRTVAIAAIVLNTTALVLTFSRHSWLGALVGVIALTFLRERKAKHAYMGKRTAILVFCILIIAVYFGMQFVQSEVSTGSYFAEDYGQRIGLQSRTLTYGLELRIERLQNALRGMSEFPVAALLGAGPGANIIALYTGRNLTYNEIFAHDFFTSFIAGWGIVAFGIFLMLYLYLMFIGYSRIRAGQINDPDNLLLIRASLGVLIIILVSMPVEHAFVTDIKMNSIMWLMLGICYAIIKLENNIRKKPMEVTYSVT